MNLHLRAKTDGETGRPNVIGEHKHKETGRTNKQAFQRSIRCSRLGQRENGILFLFYLLQPFLPLSRRLIKSGVKGQPLCVSPLSHSVAGWPLRGSLRRSCCKNTFVLSSGWRHRPDPSVQVRKEKLHVCTTGEWAGLNV